MYSPVGGAEARRGGGAGADRCSAAAALITSYARACSPRRPIRRRKCRYILTADQSDAGNAGLFSWQTLSPSLAALPPENSTQLSVTTRCVENCCDSCCGCRSAPPALFRLVLTLGIYCLPSYDWFSRGVYTATPPAIGSQYPHWNVCGSLLIYIYSIPNICGGL
eukprot:2273159-Pyramimonas_sp.AAC.1